MPFMDEPPGARLFDGVWRCTCWLARSGTVACSFTNASVNKEPKWRHKAAPLGSSRSGYQPTTYSGALTSNSLFNGILAPEMIVQCTPSVTPAPSTKSKNLVEMSWDPITRIVGSLGIYTKIDFANRTVAECHSTSSIFRGYSIFMKGKDPRDAHFITSRICGICGDNHATCANYAQNMAKPR